MYYKKEVNGDSQKHKRTARPLTMKSAVLRNSFPYCALMDGCATSIMRSGDLQKWDCDQTRDQAAV